MTLHAYSRLQKKLTRRPVLTIFYPFEPWGSAIGGINTVVRHFVKYAPEPFTVRLVGTQDRARLRAGVWHEAELSGRAIRFMPLFTLPNDNLRSPIPTAVKYTAALLARSCASDFMHFHRIEPALATFGWPGERTLFIHNDIQEQMRSGDKNGVLWRYFPSAYFALERLLIGRFDHIYSCNNRAADFYSKRYPLLSQRVSYLKNTVDTETFFAPSEREREDLRRQLARRLSLPAGTRFLLFAGRLHPQKDPLLLLAALAALESPEVHLLVAGDGDLREEVQAQINRLGLACQVTMLGRLDYAQLAQLHRTAHAFVLTSLYEGLPLAALEALASGTPVVTTDCGETPNLLTAESGIVVQSRTPAAIRDGIARVLTGHFPATACTSAAAPYGARTVVEGVYAQMWERFTANYPSEHFSYAAQP